MGVQCMRLQLKQGSQRTFFSSLFFQSAFIQNCQCCSFYRSPKDWFYTVYTHYSHSLLKADPVTHIFPAAGPPSLDVPPTCHPSVWSLTKEKQRDRGKHGSANREREMFRNMTVSSLWSERSKEKGETRVGGVGEKKRAWGEFSGAGRWILNLSL